MKARLGIIEGDGIGPEIVTQAKRVLEKIASVYGHTFEYIDIDMGGCSIDKYGTSLTDDNLALAKACDAVLLGAVGGDTSNKAWYGIDVDKRPEAGLLKLRKGLNLFANLRPVYLYKSLAKACPLISNIGVYCAPALPEDAEAVFYFPGCGSEKLFSQVGLATQAMLYHAGVQTVLPPGYLCCGYPQSAHGDQPKADSMVTENRVLFHRMANTLNYLDIKTVVVSCGTCYDALAEYRFEDIFPGCRIIDIHEYLLEKNIKLQGIQGQQYLYHNPCHTPIKTMDGAKLASELIGQNVPLSDRCCGESGMFAVKRPDIATQVKFRKQEEIEKNLAQLPQGEPVKMLTSCPACLQGLSRYAEDNNLPADYIVIEMAKRILGENWLDEFVGKAKNGGIEKVLL